MDAQEDLDAASYHQEQLVVAGLANARNLSHLISLNGNINTSIHSNINSNSNYNYNNNMNQDLSLGFLLISVILCSLMVCTFIGNSFVITAILIDKNLQTAANQLVLSLAVADLMVACLVMPLGAYNDLRNGWFLGTQICEFWTSADVLCCTASILNLLAIAIDRYWAVTNVDYIYKRTRQRVCLMILCAWSVAAFVSLAPIFGWKDVDFAHRVDEEHKCLVSQDLGYQIFATMSTFYLPLVLLLALYWRIFKVARKRIRKKAVRNVIAHPAGESSNGCLKQSRLVDLETSQQDDDDFTITMRLPNKKLNQRSALNSSSSLGSPSSRPEASSASNMLKSGSLMGASDGRKSSTKRSISLNPPTKIITETTHGKTTKAENRVVNDDDDNSHERPGQLTNKEIHNTATASTTTTATTGSGSLGPGINQELDKKTNAVVLSSSSSSSCTEAGWSVSGQQESGHSIKGPAGDVRPGQRYSIGSGKSRSGLLAARNVEASQTGEPNWFNLAKICAALRSPDCPDGTTTGSGGRNDGRAHLAAPSSHDYNNNNNNNNNNESYSHSDLDSDDHDDHGPNNDVEPERQFKIGVPSRPSEMLNCRLGSLATGRKRSTGQRETSISVIACNGRRLESSSSACSYQFRLESCELEHKPLPATTSSTKLGIHSTHKESSGNFIGPVGDDRLPMEAACHCQWDRHSLPGRTMPEVARDWPLDPWLARLGSFCSQCDLCCCQQRQPFGLAKANSLKRPHHQARPGDNPRAGSLSGQPNGCPSMADGRSTMWNCDDLRRGHKSGDDVNDQEPPDHERRRLQLAASIGTPHGRDQINHRLSAKEADELDDELAQPCYCQLTDKTKAPTPRASTKDLPLLEPLLASIRPPTSPGTNRKRLPMNDDDDDDDVDDDDAHHQHHNAADVGGACDNRDSWPTHDKRAPHYAHDELSSSLGVSSGGLLDIDEMKTHNHNHRHHHHFYHHQSQRQHQYQQATKHSSQDEGRKWPRLERNNGHAECGITKLGQGAVEPNVTHRKSSANQGFSGTATESRQLLLVSCRPGSIGDSLDMSQCPVVWLPGPSATATNNTTTTTNTETTESTCDKTTIGQDQFGSQETPDLLSLASLPSSESLSSAFPMPGRQVRGDAAETESESVICWHGRASSSNNKRCDDEAGSRTKPEMVVALPSRELMAAAAPPKKSINIPTGRGSKPETGFGRRFRALGQLVSFVQTSQRYFNSTSNSSCSASANSSSVSIRSEDVELHLGAASHHNSTTVTAANSAHANDHDGLSINLKTDTSSSIKRRSANNIQRILPAFRQLSKSVLVSRKLTTNSNSNQQQQQRKSLPLANELDSNDDVEASQDQEAPANDAIHRKSKSSSIEGAGPAELNPAKIQLTSKRKSAGSIGASVELNLEVAVNELAEESQIDHTDKCLVSFIKTPPLPVQSNGTGPQSGPEVTGRGFRRVPSVRFSNVPALSSTTTASTNDKTSSTTTTSRSHNNANQAEHSASSLSASTAAGYYSTGSRAGCHSHSLSSSSSRRANIEIRREKKAAKTLAIITGVFVCCWLPFFVNALVMPICGPTCVPSDLILSVLLWLGYLNSLLNPLIYTIFSPDFRRAFRRLLCWPSFARSKN